MTPRATPSDPALATAYAPCRGSLWVSGRRVRHAFAALGLLLVGMSAASADAPYPFEGTWVRVERVCSATTTRARSYTAKEVVSPRGHCSIRRIEASGSTYELLEECRFGDRPTRVTETIRMTSADSMTLKRQLNRLKIPRPIRYARCTIAVPGGPVTHPAKPSSPEIKGIRG